MSEKLVTEALQARVTTAVAATSFNTSKVKYIGRIFKPAADTPWLEVVQIANDIPGEFWDSGKTYRGLLRMILHWPLNDEGIYPAQLMGEAIGASFKVGTKLANAGITVTITADANITTMEMQDENLCVISVRYNCFKA